jgi:FMN-dependent NADH-azoreductase
MKTLLHIDSSLFSTNGQSSRLAAKFVEQWAAAHPGARVIRRDLGAQPVPHLTAERFGAFLAKPEERTPEQQAIASESDALVDELQAADVIVLGLPLYNFGVPSTLKAYFDHVARAGITFRYTATGPEGLLKGKKVYVFAARGGAYFGTPRDTQTGYVRDFLAFIGLTDVEFVYAEGLAVSETSKVQSIESAHLAIARLATAEALPIAA